MNIGMLWYDNDPITDLNSKIIQAAHYYKKKYGIAANQCMVNPKMLPENLKVSKQIKIVGNPTILPNHIWIGIGSSNYDSK